MFVYRFENVKFYIRLIFDVLFFKQRAPSRVYPESPEFIDADYPPPPPPPEHMRSHQVSSQLFIDSNFYSDFYNDFSGDFHAGPHHGLDGEFSAEMIHSTPPSDLLTSSDQEYGLGFPFKDSFFDQVSNCRTICVSKILLCYKSLTSFITTPACCNWVFFVPIRIVISVLEFLFLRKFWFLYSSFLLKFDIEVLVL